MTTLRNRPVRYLVLCGVLLIAAIIAGTVGVIDNFRGRAVANSERELKNTSLILAEQIDRSFQSLLLVLDGVKEQIELLGSLSSEDHARALSTYDMHLLLKHKREGLSHVDAITLISADGTLLNFSRRWPIPTVNVADRDYFQALKSDASLTSFVSAPVRNRGTGTWTVYLARKLTASNGEFLGIVLGAVELAYYENFFASLELGADTAIAMFRKDGTLLLRFPRIESMIGRNFMQGPLFQKLLSRADYGTLRLDSRIDGQDRLVAARSLKTFPIAMVTATTTSTALADWRTQTTFLIGIAALSALIIGCILMLIVRQVVHEQKTTTERITLETKRLDAAVNNLSQGLLLFDQSNRIVVCNQRYREIYGLSPDVVKPGCGLRDLIQHRKDTGSFTGDVDYYSASILGALAEGEDVERSIKTKDGRSIRILNLPVAGGGWISTHEDVTERERLLAAQHEAEELVREQKLHLDAALNNMIQGLCMFDAEGRVVLCNPRYIEMMGLPADELVGVSLLDLCRRRKAAGQPKGDPELFVASALASARAGKTTTEITETGDGRALRAIHQPMANGGWVATFEDITEQRKIEQERDRDREFLNQIINNVPTMIFVKDARTKRYLLTNKPAADYFGVSREEIVGKTTSEIWPTSTANVIDEKDEKLLRSGNDVLSGEYLIDAPARGPRFIASKKLVVRDQKDEPQYLLSVIDDVTEFKRANERIAHLAHFDALTDLPNRVLFRENLEQSLKWVRRGERVAVLYLDIDEFKSINDTLGHQVGDELLKAVAIRLRTCIRETDIVSRLGGDEFAIIQAGIQGPAEAVDLANRIHEVIKEPFGAAGHQLMTGASIGIALAPHDGNDPDELLKNADLAMYGAKAEGRGTYRFFEPEMDARVKARRALEFDLREAIMCGNFELHYQPLINLRDNNVSGCEALVRWRHHKRGFISPLEFITVAEETGLITQLGELVLRTACAEAATWPNDIKVAVNVSPVQFKNGNIVQLVISALAASRLPACRLELEITEAVFIHDDDAVLNVLHQLRNLGVRIAMDDFGTGYSSLSYLQRFPFDKIKIDRSFIKDVAEPDGSLSIVQAVVAIAQSRNITTTAEGVETEPQLKQLRTLGCTEIQGYLFSPPKPAAEVFPLLLSLGKREPAVA